MTTFGAVAQQVFLPLYDNDSYLGEPNTSLPVGYTPAEHGVQSGAALYTIPIALPPGNNGNKPQISINYSSHTVQGLLGVGWDLALGSAITRVGGDFYYNSGRVSPTVLQDIGPIVPNRVYYALDGNRLTATNVYGGTHATVNESYSKITLTSGGFWEVKTKLGVTMIYGETSNARIGDSRGTLSWRLSKVIDLDGSVTEYEYYPYTTSDVHTSECLIKEIKWGGHVNDTPLHHYNKARFSYRGGLNFFGNSLYELGFELKSAALLDKIEVLHEQQILKTYSFVYGHDNVHCYLREVVETGEDGSSFNSTKFKYGSQPAQQSLEMPNDFVGNSFCDLSSGDFDGDGKDEIVKMYRVSQNPNVTDIYYYSRLEVFKIDVSGNYVLLSTIQLDPNTSMVNRGRFPDPSAVLMQDFTGDGVDDICTFRATYNSSQNRYELHEVAVYESINGGTSFQKRAFLPQVAENIIDIGAPFINFGDFDGDGAQDFFLVLKCTFCGPNPTHGYYIAYPSLMPHTGLPQTVLTVGLADLNDGPRQITPNYDLSQTMDFDGDGKSEIFIRKGNKVQIWTFITFTDNQNINPIGKRYLLWEGSVNDPTQKVFHRLETPFTQLFQGDFNGDGKTDLFYGYQYFHNGNDYYQWYISYSTGKGFVTEFANVSAALGYNHGISTNLSFSDFTLNNGQPLYFGDFNGDGKTDIVNTRYGRIDLGFWAEIYYSKGKGSFRREALPSGIVDNQLNWRAIMGDFNGDGRYDLLYKNNNNRPYILYL